jgi:hypothetical protein
MDVELSLAGRSAELLSHLSHSPAKQLIESLESITDLTAFHSALRQLLRETDRRVAEADDED